MPLCRTTVSYAHQRVHWVLEEAMQTAVQAYLVHCDEQSEMPKDRSSLYRFQEEMLNDAQHSRRILQVSSH